MYIYCTYGNEKENYCVGKRGKVIGEFVCDRIYSTLLLSTDGGSADLRRQYYLIGENDKIIWKFWRESCIQPEELAQYINQGEMCYGWHISKLKIYDKPRELGEFRPWCEKSRKTDDNLEICCNCKNAFFDEDGAFYGCGLTRPPQSWSYVEE